MSNIFSLFVCLSVVCLLTCFFCPCSMLRLYKQLTRFKYMYLCSIHLTSSFDVAALLPVFVTPLEIHSAFYTLAKHLTPPFILLMVFPPLESSDHNSIFVSCRALPASPSDPLKRRCFWHCLEWKDLTRYYFDCLLNNKYVRVLQ